MSDFLDEARRFLGEAETPDQKLGKYRLIRQVARGGMGIVYEAEDPDLGRRVALKVLHDEAIDEEMVRRLHREAAVAARLSHPNIIAVHEVAAARRGEELVHYIVMDFVEGGTLGEALREGRLARADRIRMLEEVARAVGYAHSRGVIHRDLKPGNVLIDAHGRVVLTDFGLARADTHTRLTRSNAVMGTPQYMAPEQVGGMRDEIGPRSDVYALGVMLYEMLTGRLPFDADTPVEIYTRILHQEPEPPSRIDRTVDRDLEIICLKAMEKDSRRRYPDATEFAEDLRRFREGEPVHARPPSVLHLIWKRIRKRKELAASLAVTLVLGAIALAYFAVQSGRQTRERREAEAWRSEADRKFATGDFLGAKELYDRARARVSIPEARYAECSERVAELRRKKEEEEVLGPVLEHLSRLSDDADGWKRGIQLLDPVLAAFPRSWRGWMERGNRSAKLLRHDEALEDYRKALAANPRLGVAHYMRGRILMDGRERKDDALVEFRKAQEVEPGNEFALVGEARIAAIDGRYGEAIDVCDRAETGGKHLEELYYVRAWARARRRRSGDLERALSDFDVAIGKRRTPWSYCGRGITKCLLQRQKEGVQDLSDAIAIDPAYAPAYKNRGSAWMELENVQAALKDFDEAIRLNPEDGQAYLYRSTARRAVKKFREAIEDCDRAIERIPTLAVAYHNRGCLRLLLQDRSRALADFSKSLELDPDAVETLYNRACLYHDLGEVDRSLGDLDRLIGLRPAFRASRVLRGRIYLAKRRWDAAIADFDEALRLENDADARFYRGTARQAKEDWNGALEDFGETIRLAPRQGAARVNRGAVLLVLDRFDEAIEDFEAAIAIDPALPEGWGGRGQARLAKEDRDGAASDFARALELAPPNWPHREWMSEELKKLKK